MNTICFVVWVWQADTFVSSLRLSYTKDNNAKKPHTILRQSAAAVFDWTIEESLGGTLVRCISTLNPPLIGRLGRRTSDGWSVAWSQDWRTVATGTTEHPLLQTATWRSDLLHTHTHTLAHASARQGASRTGSTRIHRIGLSEKTKQESFRTRTVRLLEDSCNGYTRIFLAEQFLAQVVVAYIVGRKKLYEGRSIRWREDQHLS